MAMQLALPQMSAIAEWPGIPCGEAVGASASEETGGPRYGSESTGPALLEAALARENLQAAFKRVRANKGAAGVDGLDIDQTATHLATAWPLIQQALRQVLQPLLDPTFSEHSYGFRPGRRAHDAVLAAQAYVQSGRRIVVDVDLEKFFDRVNHDILIDRLQKRIAAMQARGLLLLGL